MRSTTAFPPQIIVIVATAFLGGLIGLVATGQGLVAIGLPLLLVAGGTLCAYPVLGLYLFAILIPLEAALMFGGVTAARIIGIAAFGAWAAHKLLRREPLLPLLSPGLIRIAILLFALICLSLIWADYPDIAQRRLLTIFQLVLLTILALDLTASWERVTWVSKVLVLAATAAAVLTLEQYVLGEARRAGEGIAGGLNRTAVILVTLLPFAIFLLRSNEALFWRVLGMTYIGMSAIAVSTTLSRMNFLLFPLVIIVHLFFMVRTRRGQRQIILLGAVAIVAISLLPMDIVRDRATTIAPYLVHTVDADQSTEHYSTRGFLMRGGIAMFRDQPLLGVGWQNFGMRFFTEYQWEIPGAHRVWGMHHVPHGSHVTFLAQLGIVGFALWIGLFVIAGRSLWHAWRQVHDRPASTQALLVQAVAVATGLQFFYGFYGEVHEFKVFWFLLGLSIAVHRLSTTRTTRPNLPERPGVLA